jgi:flavin-dependent dehydrogenase
MDTDPIRRFTELRDNCPELSDSMLLNLNNQTRFTGNADVAVGGAGIIGLCYAIHLKNISPHLKIEVFEKSPAPVQKIGESTLSSFSKFTNGDILPQDYLFRLFGLKDGLKFYCIDQHGLSVTSEDIGGLDLSFQLDRRMSELFLTMWAQKMGINVYHGVDIGFEIADDDAFDTSTSHREEAIAGSGLKNRRTTGSFKPPRVALKDSSQSTGTSVSAKLVCDATGFSRKLTSKFGNKEKFEGWNCDAYWAYFKERDVCNVESRLDHWDYPATKHICFPEGWGWFIKLISWHQAPLANLMDLVAYVIYNAKSGVPADDIPCTKDLSDIFDCPYEFITSIGFAVRNDYKLPENLDEYGYTESERKFTYFKRKYPTLNCLINRSYNLLPRYYGERTYFVRKSLAFQSPVVAGEGWLAVGNSAGFTNPLISPGINAGIGSAFLAATLTEKILAAPEENSRAVMQRSAEIYQTYIHDFMMPRLHQMNRMWYNMFRDHRLFEALVRCFWSLGVDAIDTRYGDQYTAEDLKWLVGAGSDDFQQFCGDVLKIMEPSDGVAPSEQAVEKIQALSHQCLSRRSKLYPGNKWGRYLRRYDDRLQKVPGKHEREAGSKYFALQCIGCKYWMHNNANICPLCGNKRSSE